MFGIPLQLALQLGGTVVALGVFAWVISGYNGAIENRTVVKIERANENATFKGKRAAARSSDRGVRGARDPSTRDD